MPATTEKPPTLAKELAALERMTAAELRDRYAAVFGELAASGNRAWLAGPVPAGGGATAGDNRLSRPADVAGGPARPSGGVLRGRPGPESAPGNRPRAR